MPNINLRLSEEEHEALRTWAFEGRRSIQREIIFRLFSGLREGEPHAAKAVVARESPTAVSPSSPSLSSANVGAGQTQPAADNPDPHFRPDPK